MGTWFAIGVGIVAALGFGLLSEKFRVSAIERWVREKGFTRKPSPFTPAASDPPAMLTALLHPRGARVWGIAVDGMIDAAPCSVAEYAVTKVGTRSADQWFTLVWWHSPQGEGNTFKPKWNYGVPVRDGDYAGLQLPGTITAVSLDAVVGLMQGARQRS